MVVFWLKKCLRMQHFEIEGEQTSTLYIYDVDNPLDIVLQGHFTELVHF